ncbi:Transport protein particle [Wickerhamomyces ciferrii]|uniref:Transport protein particle n=1 Tax=Wickerhamomyces ciferrii (strain ATCC 14091 / BCRC 22168 / CBS 111 / JCM 3599 / NBRC 0793 / NRRL Y-1031 F-60-10) TaxID=1206466 RepID=K0KNG5_WICCF|nr:Transport protein particle [Wickerhamomyces ciferrii]CCH43722.1 Transport protein particle [Wickerhamomyces ciferrii]
MDSHSYTAPSRVKALLVPLGNVSEVAFKNYVEKIKSSYEVRLVDVTPTENSLFNPQGFPQGRVIYDFQLSLNDQESIFLNDFEPFRKTFVVIGITDSSNISHNDLELLSKHYKSSITHSIIVFGDGDHNDMEHKQIFHQSNKINIETILCDITGLFLNDLASYLSSFQHITLRSPGTIGSNDRIKAIEPSKRKRISSGSSLSISMSDSNNPKLSLSSSAERRQSKVRGRQLKILGNLYLLAGKYNNALKELNDAVPLLRISNDYLWLGSTLESIGVCLVMLTFLGVPYQMPSSLNQILHTSMTIPTPSATPISTPRNSMVFNGGSSSTGTATTTTTTTTGNQSSVNSTDISRYTTPELINLISIKVIHYYEISQNDHEDYVPQLVFCESILRFVKFMCVVNIGGGFNQTTIDHIVRGKNIRPKYSNVIFDKMEIVKIANKILTFQLKTMDILSQAKIYTSLASVFGDLNLLRKRSFIIRTLFISLIPELSNNDQYNNNNGKKTHNLSELLDTILSIYGIGRSPESLILDSYSSRWVQLHKSILQLCIIICSKIQDYKKIVQFKSLLITRYSDSLTDNEQSKILNEIQNICKEQDYIQFNYFDPLILRGLEVLKPINPPKKQSNTIVSDQTTKADPFLYNPYAKPLVTDETYFVQDEFMEFQISVQNPFAFPLQINDVQIESFEILKNFFIIQPKSLSVLNVLVKPIKSGVLKISEIGLKIFDCQLQFFKISSNLKPEFFNKLKKTSKDLNVSILENYDENILQNKIEDKVITQELTLNVINSQPNIQLINEPEHIMLLEGGSQTINLKIKNNSPILANHLEFSVWDSTIEPLKNVLNNKGLPSNEVYEIEYFLFKNPLTIKTEIKELQPFEEKTLEVELNGKRGMNQVNLILDYGHKLQNQAFTRRMEIPIKIMVNPSTDLAGCDILPLVQNVDSKSGKVWSYINEKTSQTDKNGKNLIISDFALFLIDLRNVWNKTLNLDIKYDDFEINESIVPMETKRILIPIKRIQLDDDNLDIVPSLSKKQYILPKITKAEDQYIKEAFWYRKEILKKLSGNWKIGEITGSIEFRGVRLSQRMLTTLKTDKLNIKIDVKTESQDHPVQTKGLYKLIPIDEFFTINIKIHNNTSRSIKGVLRNIPMASNFGSIDRRLLFNGVLQQPLLNSIKPDETLEFKIGAIILEKGEYEWGVLIDELDSERSHIARDPLKIISV